jgi:hypothetical protein
MNPPPISGVSDDSKVQKLLISVRFLGVHGRVASHAATWRLEWLYSFPSRYGFTDSAPEHPATTADLAGSALPIKH